MRAGFIALALMSCLDAGPEPVVPGPPGPDPQQAVADHLTKEIITDGMTAVKAAVWACDDFATHRDTLVKVHVIVTPDGSASAEAVGSPEPALAACVTAAVDRATFAATRLGGSFTYPFVF